MRVNCRGVGDQSVERDERRNGGKDGQQRIEHDPGRDREQAIIIHARINAREDILPTCPGNAPRSRRPPPPSLLLRSAQLRENRLIVLELLPWPLVGIEVCRQTRVARDFGTLIRRGAEYPAWFGNRLVAAARAGSLGRSPGLLKAHGGDCDESTIDQKRPYASTFRHSFRPEKGAGRQLAQTRRSKTKS